MFKLNIKGTWTKKDLKLLKDPDRFYNWYHGFTAILIPYSNNIDDLTYEIQTLATHGSISTENFGGDPPIGSRENYSDSHHHLPEGGDGRPLSWASETQGPGQAPF